MVDEGFLQAIKQAMLAHRDNAEVQSNARRVLCQIACGAPDTAGRMVNEGFIQAIKQVMKAPTSSSSTTMAPGFATPMIAADPGDATPQRCDERVELGSMHVCCVFASCVVLCIYICRVLCCVYMSSSLNIASCVVPKCLSIYLSLSHTHIYIYIYTHRAPPPMLFRFS